MALEAESFRTWPPKPPDLDVSEVRRLIDFKPFRIANSHIYRFKDAPIIYKSGGSLEEYRMMELAGDCSVRPRGRALSPYQGANNYIVKLEGILMDLETPLERETIETLDREKLMRQMIRCVERLHSVYGVVHGDVKPPNMLISSDGKVHLCDFAESRTIHDDPEDWEGMTTVNYISPNRSHGYDADHLLPPTPSDDLYSLGLSIWEIFTGKRPFDGVYEDDIVKELMGGGTVDITLVSQPHVREIIREYLVQGGATSLRIPPPPASTSPRSFPLLLKLRAFLWRILVRSFKSCWTYLRG